MNKAQLIEKLKDVEEDEEIVFTIFNDNNYMFYLLNPSAQHDRDPHGVISLVTNNYVQPRKTLEDLTERVRKAVKK